MTHTGMVHIDFKQPLQGVLQDMAHQQPDDTAMRDQQNPFAAKLLLYVIPGGQNARLEIQQMLAIRRRVIKRILPETG